MLRSRLQSGTLQNTRQRRYGLKQNYLYKQQKYVYFGVIILSFLLKFCKTLK
jgi:hypothetical protein